MLLFAILLTGRRLAARMLAPGSKRLLLLVCWLLLSWSSIIVPVIARAAESTIAATNMALGADRLLTIRFATEATYPPFESINAAGDIVGFDIDIAKALCEQLQAHCSFSHQTFNALIEGVKVGKFDAAIAGMGITDTRKQQVAFSLPYYTPSASYIASVSKHYQISDLIHKTIGVQQGSTFEQYLHDDYGDKVQVKSYTSVQDIFLDLLAERLDAALVDTAIALTWLQVAPVDSAKRLFTVVGTSITDPVYFGLGYGIAVNKHNTGLLMQLNTALLTIKQRGVYQQIFNHYFVPHK